MLIYAAWIGCMQGKSVHVYTPEWRPTLVHIHAKELMSIGCMKKMHAREICTNTYVHTRLTSVFFHAPHDLLHARRCRKRHMQWYLHWADIAVHWGPCSRMTTTQRTATKESNHRAAKQQGASTKCGEEKCSVATAWARTYKLHAFLTLVISDLYMYGAKTWNASKVI